MGLLTHCYLAYHQLLDALYPPRCAGCDTVCPEVRRARPLCPACDAGTQWLRHAVGSAHFPEPAWSGVAAICRFEGPMSAALHRLKYQRRADLAVPLGDLLADAPLASVSKAGQAVHPADLVVPVPLTARRLRARGYNQALLLARRAAKTWGLPVVPDALQRADGTPQVGLDAKTRLANVRGAFSVHAKRRHHVRDRRILLIDDVMTTGATLDACARTLRRAGAADVQALVLACA